MTIGERIRSLREQQGLKQKELAQRLEMHQGYLSRLETNHVKTVTVDTLAKLAFVFTVSTEELMQGVQSEVQQPTPAPISPKKETLHVPGMVYTSRIKARRPDLLVEQQTELEEEKIWVMPFATDPARVSIEMRCSVMVDEEEWQGVIVRLERPCYVEEMEIVQEEVIEVAEQLINRERSKLLMKKAQESFGRETTREVT